MAEELKPQKRSRKIAMTDAERDEFLASERTCRVATISPDGPHNTPLWFAWDGSILWLYSIVRSQRWVDLQRDPRVAIIVDAGDDYVELRGVEISGQASIVGDVPRTGDVHVDELVAAERLFADKYMAGGQFVNDGRHAWLKVVPDKISSWDFRKAFGAAAG
jgi:hypothetical protein